LELGCDLSDEDGLKTGWYLLQTKAGEERKVEREISRFPAEVLLPLMKVRVRRWSKMVETVAPLFPCYVFVLFDPKRDYTRIRFTRGVRELVRFGPHPVLVPEWIIEGLKQRCAHGPVELPKRRLSAGESVTVVDGPLRELEGIFEQYLSGMERVAILLTLMGGTRVVLPANKIVSLASGSAVGPFK
jgi:transcriptional antiterminator RfaH